MSCALIPASASAAGNVATPAPLARIARAWVLGETGVLTCGGRRGAGAIALPLLQGGLATLGTARALDYALKADSVHFVPRRAAGTGLRAVVAQALLHHALVPTDRSWLEGCAPPDVTLLAPLPVLEELGLYPRLRWRPTIDGIATELTGRAALGVQLRAMERLGLARLSTAPKARPTARPPFALRPRSAAAATYRHYAEVEDLFGASGLVPEADEEGEDTFDLDGVYGVEHDGSEEAVGRAVALLDGGEWERAEQVLSALRDTRLDNPTVLAWLAVARVADPGRRTPERIADAQAWARLARTMAPETDEVARALIRMPQTLQERSGRPAAAGARA